MSTVKIEDLEYIVLEGGGARGAAYLGAIQALEEKMTDYTRDIATIKLAASHADPIALMDYYREVGDKKIPVIKGVAGSSAGAITTFALALGCNSEHCATILDSKFIEFLSEEDPGVYRMVSEDGMPAIGGDKNSEGRKNDLAYKKDYTFDFTKNFLEVGGNPGKKIVRQIAVRFGIKVILDGLLRNVELFIEKFGYLEGLLGKVQFLKGISSLFKNAAAGVIGTQALSQLLFKWATKKVGMRIDPDTVCNILFDNGAYSGFKVREFFMDVMILALKENTLFSRNLEKQLKDKTFLDAIKELDIYLSDKAWHEHSSHFNKVLDFETLKGKLGGFKIGHREDCNLDKEAPELILLSLMTFKGLYKLTGVNFGLCVSNYTTNCPLYFGHEWTPDFLVMEAVAGTMAIPPVLKPVYNEANVVGNGYTDVSVSTGGGGDIPFVKDGNFTLADYYFYEQVVKKALQQRILKSENVSIDTNNNVQINTFLPELRKIVVGEKQENDTPSPPAKETVNTNVTLGGRKTTQFVVDYDLFLFFYNAAYKGMFLDGGYLQNIPYHFFRIRNENLNNVLAIKLDRHFPPEMTDQLIKSALYEINTLDPEDFDDEPILSADNDPAKKLARQKVLQNARIIYQDFLTKNPNDKGQILKDEKALKRFAKATVKTYRKSRYSKPWAIRKSILEMVSEGYAWGSENGQVQSICDHDHILPLYDYGVGTYDFDMSKVRPMVKLAQTQAYEDVKKYFED